MTILDRTEDDLNQEKERFLAAPHSAKSLYAEARHFWEQEEIAARDSGMDRWAAVVSYTAAFDGAKPRPFGAEIVTELRKHLSKLQSNRCCYCRRWLQNIAYARPIEHVLSRKDYPQFSMHYSNLAICCRDCNQLKSAKRWSSLDTATLEYPKKVEDYFHPRIHVYNQHIRYVRIETNDTAISIYHGLSFQGRQLCRDHLKTISHVESLLKNNPRLAASISTLQNAGEIIDLTATVKLKEFLDALHAAVHRIATQ